MGIKKQKWKFKKKNKIKNVKNEIEKTILKNKIEKTKM